MLRARKTRREQPLEVHVPDPIIARADGSNPEHEALLAASVGLALLVVLETLTPAERLAFVLHDMFAVPFEDIAPIMERSPQATRQLASRARRHVRGVAPVPDADLTAQWEVVEAFLAASREGDFDALVAVLEPDAVLRADGGSTGLSQHIRGAETIASQALLWSRVDLSMRRVVINGDRRVRQLPPAGGRSQSPPSRSRMGGSSKSTSSPIPNGSRSSSSQSFTISSLAGERRGRGAATWSECERHPPEG
jgi:hypothetical protein